MFDRAILEEATRLLVERFQPQRIILFGSYARGTADDRSDVDLLVICPIRGDRGELMLAMDQTLRGLRLARDIVVLSPEEFEGKLLYDSAA